MKRFLLLPLLIVALTAQSVVFTAPTATPAKPEILSAETTFAVLKMLGPRAEVELTDPSFTTVTKAWMLDYLVFWNEYKKAHALKYVTGTFDCEDFARLFAALAAKKAAEDGIQYHGITIGVVGLVFINDYGFGTDITGAHAINFALVTEADGSGMVYLIEPQSGKMVPFTAYPDPQNIFCFKLGT